MTGFRRLSWLLFRTAPFSTGLIFCAALALSAAWIAGYFNPEWRDEIAAYFALKFTDEEMTFFAILLVASAAGYGFYRLSYDYVRARAAHRK